MGFLSRWRFLSKPRTQGSGKLWDNINSPGSKGTPLTTMSGNASQGPTENYYQPGPNPERYLLTGESADPNRLHSHVPKLQPPIPVRVPSTPVGNETYIISQAPVANPKVLPRATPLTTRATTLKTIREVEYDAGDNRNLQRFYFVTPSQQYYNERMPLPEFTTPSVHAHSVYAQPVMYRRGWAQQLVPEPGMSVNHIGKAPPWLLSAPMHVTTDTTAGVSGHRSPIKNARAPRRKRSA